jgi:hypothetical protein
LIRCHGKYFYRLEAGGKESRGNHHRASEIGDPLAICVAMTVIADHSRWTGTCIPIDEYWPHDLAVPARHGLALEMSA